MERYVQVVTTVEAREDAERIALALVERRLAACVQIDGPIASVYHWNAAVERAPEWRCTIKTTGARFDAVRDALVAVHPYETPEIVALPIVAGSASYLAWLDQMTAPLDDAST